jgi:hypothetical protein
MNTLKVQKNPCLKMKLNSLLVILFIGMSNLVYSQKGTPVIKATSEKTSITDGKNFKMDWRLEPGTKPDIYYVNIPAKKSIVQFQTDKEKLTIRTKPGKVYDFIVLLNETDSCYIQISSALPPDLPQTETSISAPVHFPFNLIGSKIFFDGRVNGKNGVIELDLGAGTSVVNRNVSGKFDLDFTSHKIVSNTDGVNKERTSPGNRLTIGSVEWKDVPLTEVGNMKLFEDIIIGNGFFRDKIIEINYDTKQFTIHETLPAIKGYQKLPVYYEQNRPKFEAEFVHNNKKYKFWFLFDSGRDGTMLIGEDFTSIDKNWDELQPLTIINERKIIRLDASIAGIQFKDIVTNAANPSKPNGRPSLFGNQILNHFNVILDNKNGFIYLKPNSRTKEPYFNYESYLKEMSKKDNQ